MSEFTAVTVNQRINLKNLYNRFIAIFGEPIGHVDNIASFRGSKSATVFWAAAPNWNETMLKNWVGYPVRFIGPMMGNEVTGIKKENRPAGGGYVVYLMDEEARI